VWYHVDDDGKISSVKVIFDPRAFLEGSQAEVIEGPKKII
jgi:hypothetical protein